MKVIYLLLAASLVVALFFLALFIKAVKQGQFDDTWSPSRRILMDDEPVEKQGTRHDLPAEGMGDASKKKE